MTVGADVLNRGSGGKSGDFAESFDAGEASFAGVGDNIVPRFATHDFDSVVVFVWVVTCFCNIGNAAHAIDNNDATKTFITANSVGATTEDENWEILGGGKFVSFGDFTWLLNFDAIFGGATDAHSSDARNQNIFANSHNMILAQNEFCGKFFEGSIGVVGVGG